MLTGAFILLLSAFLTGFLQLLPSATGSVYSQEMTDGWVLFTTKAVEWDNIVPVIELLSALGIYVVAWGIVIVWLLVRWTLQFIRGSGS